MRYLLSISRCLVLIIEIEKAETIRKPRALRKRRRGATSIEKLAATAEEDKREIGGNRLEGLAEA
jgi:hypothetical protein